jgi:hypothetical protein
MKNNKNFKVDLTGNNFLSFINTPEKTDKSFTITERSGKVSVLPASHINKVLVTIASEKLDVISVIENI